MEEGQILRAALGSVASLGNLYDARSEKFINASIFKNSIPQIAIRTNPVSYRDVQLFQEDTLHERFRMFGVNGNQQLSLLAGLITPTHGCGTYLKDELNSDKIVRGCLLQTLVAIEESVDLSNDKLQDAIGSTGSDIGDRGGTHVVVGISWGARILLSCQAEVTGEDPKESKDRVAAALARIANGIQAEPHSVDGNHDDGEGLHWKLFADILPETTQIRDTASAIEELSRVPNLITGINEGKGVPLIYTLAPITALRSFKSSDSQAEFEPTWKSVPKETVQGFLNLFDGFNQIQQRINGLCQDLFRYRVGVQTSDIKTLKALKKQMADQEKMLTIKLATTLPKVQTGEVGMAQMENLLSEFENSQFSPDGANTILSSFEPYKIKIGLMRSFGQQGVTYIGMDGDLDNNIKKNLHCKTFIFFFTTKAQQTEPDMWNKTVELFKKTLEEGAISWKWFVVDCDIHRGLMPKVKTCVIQVVQNGLALSEDLLADRIREESSALVKVSAVKKTNVKPKKLVPLVIPCTGKQCDPETEHEWKCAKCYTTLEWGFDEHLYCVCGKSRAISASFKCTDDRHGPHFERHEESNLANLLQELKPYDEINILILGETGVGKSTWINAFVNFVNNPTLDEAELHDLITLIPSRFTVSNEDYEEITVDTGSDGNEVLQDGQSATQGSKVYDFRVNRTIIRLIDTPGVGDTRGIEQDKVNFKNILDTLSNLDEIHGICVLLKPNNARVNIMFRFCIKELLTHLHRDAAHNIMFCFTNSRGTFYRPGDTMPALRSLLSENKQVKITLSKDTIYCYDSEAYRFLAAMKNKPPVTFPEHERQNFAQSWEKSITETNRMLEHIRSLKPHPIQSTLNLNHARDLVLKLTRPLAEISRNIQTNKAIVQDEKKMIENTKENIEQLKKGLMTTRTEIEVIEIGHPKTVCSNGKCVKVWKGDGNIAITEYVQVCHGHCHLSGVQKDSIGDPALMGCWAMENGNCRHSTCGHSYREHLHVYYESRQVPRQVEDEAVKEALTKNLSAKEMKKRMIDGKNQLIAEYEQELKTIQEASIKFAYFLKTNAITPYNDAMEQYLDHLIQEENHKALQGGSRKVMELLKESKARYLQQRHILEEAMKNGERENNVLTPKEIENMVTQLKALPHSGESLRDALDCVTRTRTVVYRDALVSVPNPKRQHYHQHQYQPHQYQQQRQHGPQRGNRIWGWVQMVKTGFGWD